MSRNDAARRLFWPAVVYPIGAQDLFDNVFCGRMAAQYGANPPLTRLS